MSHYTSLARAFRPQKFSEVIGQGAIVQTLKNAIALGRVSHAYMFCGIRGTGKTTLARVFAKAINCHNLSSDFEPCGTCSSCSEIASANALDVIEIDGASSRGIDDIRQLNETVSYAPSSCKYKIYIIDEVHMLTKEAFNALLKTLEEPPAHVKFFFATTEPHKVLPTILSRCQRFDLSRISIDDIAKKLSMICNENNLQVENDALFLIAKIAAGSLRDAEAIFDQLLCYDEKELTVQTVEKSLHLNAIDSYFKLDESIKDQNLSFAFDLSSKVFTLGYDLSYFTNALTEHFTTHLKIKLSSNATLSLSDELKNKYLHLSPIYSREDLLYILETLFAFFQSVNSTEISQPHIELLLLNLIRVKSRVDLDALINLPTSQEKSVEADTKEVAKQAPPPLLNKTPSTPEQKAPLPTASKLEQPAPAPQEISNTPAPVPIDKKFENLLRFTSVELNGVVKK